MYHGSAGWCTQPSILRYAVECRDSQRKKKLVLGFCFSFPLEQTARDSGTLIKWVKGFENAGVEGRNVVELLQDAFHRKVCPAPCQVSHIPDARLCGPGWSSSARRGNDVVNHHQDITSVCMFRDSDRSVGRGLLAAGVVCLQTWQSLPHQFDGRKS